MHATFLLLLAWVALSHWMDRNTGIQVIEGVGFVLALFGCVVLHELGHALMARRYGIATRDITLLPIGGVARLERMPDNPIEELWVALAGPAVNVVIAATLFTWLIVSQSWPQLEDLTVTTGPFLHRLLMVNIFLALFNMLPAFPMDGGRVLRALLATRLDYTLATQIAAKVGQAMALVFAFIGFFSNPFLMFIALFVWIGAAEEAHMVAIKTALGGIPVHRAMMTDFQTLSSDDPLTHAFDLMLAGSQKDFPVVDGEKISGVLCQSDVLATIPHRTADTRIGDVMRTEFEIANSHEMLETAFRRLADCPCHTIPVLHHGALVGLLTMENVGELVRIQAVIGTTPRHPKQKSNIGVQETRAGGVLHTS